MVREVWIQPVLNGFIVKVGCQKVVFTSIVKMADAITDYFTNPDEYEPKFLKEHTLNKVMDRPAVDVGDEVAQPSELNQIRRYTEETTSTST